jgi:hypothetical protein
VDRVALLVNAGVLLGFVGASRQLPRNLMIRGAVWPLAPIGMVFKMVWFTASWAIARGVLGKMFSRDRDPWVMWKS